MHIQRTMQSNGPILWGEQGMGSCSPMWTNCIYMCAPQHSKVMCGGGGGGGGGVLKEDEKVARALLHDDAIA